MDKTFIGACGLNCESCGARLAYINNDNEMRIKTAKEWSEMFNADIKPENVNCNGCMSEGIKFGHCTQCQIRSCVIDHKIANCAECSDFPCTKINQFLEFATEAKENLDKLRN